MAEAAHQPVAVDIAVEHDEEGTFVLFVGEALQQAAGEERLPRPHVAGQKRQSLHPLDGAKEAQMRAVMLLVVIIKIRERHDLKGFLLEIVVTQVIHGTSMTSKHQHSTKKHQ